MPNNEISTGKKSNGQFTVDYQKNGNGGCIPVIDGTPEPMFKFGYVSEEDREAGLRLIGEALRATNGNKYQAMQYMMNAVTVAANDIKPDEVVEVQGNEILISYANKKAYLNTTELANLDDLDCQMPNEAVKALLVSRVETELERRAEQARIEMNLYLERNDDEDYEEEEELEEEFDEE